MTQIARLSTGPRDGPSSSTPVQFKDIARSRNTYPPYRRDGGLIGEVEANTTPDDVNGRIPTVKVAARWLRKAILQSAGVIPLHDDA